MFNKNYKLLSYLFLIVTIFVIIQPSHAQEDSFSWQNVWRTIQELIKKQPPPDEKTTGSRGNKVCALLPYDSQQPLEVFNPRPLFIWQGDVFAIGVNLIDNSKTKILWSVTGLSDNGLKSMRYPNDATKLESNQKYNVEFWEEGQKHPVSFPFQIVNQDQRETIEAKLETFANLPEEKEVLAKVNYFLQENLWLDALEAVYTVENPSPELQEVVNKIKNDFICNKEENTITN